MAPSSRSCYPSAAIHCPRQAGRLAGCSLVGPSCRPARRRLPACLPPRPPARHLLPFPAFATGEKSLCAWLELVSAGPFAWLLPARLAPAGKSHCFRSPTEGPTQRGASKYGVEGGGDERGKRSSLGVRRARVRRGRGRTVEGGVRADGGPRGREGVKGRGRRHS